LGSQIAAGDVARIMGLAFALIVLIGVLSLLIARAASLPPTLTSAFILTTSFMNAGNYGLSIHQFAFGEDALAWAVLFFITSAMMTNSAGVYLASLGRARPLAALVGLLKVPSLYAIPLALLLRTLRVDLPLPLARPIELLADAAIPSMLLLLGMNIGQAGIPTQHGLLAGSVGIRLLVSPLLAWGLARLFFLPPAGAQAAVLEAAMPTAVLSTLIASEFQVEPRFVSGAVLVSTILSPLTVTPIILWLTA
jgi:hypothetical protein